MLKAAHPGGLIPPILHPSPLNRENTGERTDRTGALLFAGAVASFGLALVLIGAAVSFAAGAPAPAEPRPVDPSCSDPWQRPAPWRHSA